ncbi:hypothetical protein CMV_002114 [Castanea mollissima]|uniref:Peptidoglycan binding-like domain-containing protein n=1 Tax=Castanea mollissima TaxID=60419 RepID=A0A8J4VXS7_9ROSI|nr:hypothetical protein CMV_002114 [Castanea mollissima]
MSSSLTLLSLNPPFHLKHRHKPHSTLLFPILKLPSLSLFKSHICHSSGSSEEIRWLREEQRWLREEQRWLREEQRWARERDSLLREISDLKLKIQALEGASSVLEAQGLMLLGLKEKGLIAETGSSVVLEEEKKKKDVIRVSEKQTRQTLRKGSEGAEVQAMQEALQKMGFYSGEEDMEYSSFSSGTERAVKTWQASLGAPEDGIMTAELLERLYVEQQIIGAGSNVDADQKGSTLTASPMEGANGAPVASIMDISEVKQTVVNEESVTEVEVSQHRVFLLGENRWEEPSRLVGRNKPFGNSKTKDTITKCLTCRGEGRLMCTECDGTGEPNIEPQFMEWVEEGTKCPYCEGLGYTVCDVCGGKQ